MEIWSVPLSVYMDVRKLVSEMQQKESLDILL